MEFNFNFINYCNEKKEHADSANTSERRSLSSDESESEDDIVMYKKIYLLTGQGGKIVSRFPI